MVLVFDTETTGLNPYKDSIKEIAWQVFTIDGALEKECYFVGNIQKAIEEFKKDVEQSHYFVGHKVEYDIIMMAQYLPAELIKKMNNGKICTMKQSAEFMGVPAMHGGYKYPKLSQLYQKLFGEDFENPHQAMADTQACASCFFELLNRKIISL